MDYKKTETEIIEATKEFAIINNIHYDELTESMILNAMRELNKCFIADVVRQSEQLCEVCGNDGVFETSDGFIVDCPRCN